MGWHALCDLREKCLLQEGGCQREEEERGEEREEEKGMRKRRDIRATITASGG